MVEEKVGIQKYLLQEFEDIANEMCDNYCKYPELYSGDSSFDEMLDKICKDCPLNRLL